MKSNFFLMLLYVFTLQTALSNDSKLVSCAMIIPLVVQVEYRDRPVRNLKVTLSENNWPKGGRYPGMTKEQFKQLNTGKTNSLGYITLYLWVNGGCDSNGIIFGPKGKLILEAENGKKYYRVLKKELFVKDSEEALYLPKTSALRLELDVAEIIGGKSE